MLEQFPERITPHLQRLIDTSEAVAIQFRADQRELNEISGEPRCFTGLLHTGIDGVERMYPDRCIIMPVADCPAYCRFCFRKFYQRDPSTTMTYEQLDRALAFVAAQTSLHEVLITGGEPVLDRQRLQYLLAGLRRLDHIGPVRVACRSLVTCPTLVDRELIALLRDHQDLRTGRPIEVVMHCNHVDELSTETVDRLVQLREAGLHVCNQTVLLRQVNLDATAMLALLRRLRDHGVESYHLYFAGPVLGMDHMRPTLQQALELKAELRARATGRINPHLIVTTRVGKVELGVDGWVVEREADQRHVWIRTPHTLEIFQQIDPTFRLPDECRLDHDGRIVARYLDGPLHG